MNQQATLPAKSAGNPGSTVYKILFIIGFCHLLNDSIQPVIPAMFPILENRWAYPTPN